MSVKDANGNVTTNAYDGSGNLLSVTDPLGKTTTRAYGTASQVSALTDPSGGTTDPLGVVTTFTSDPNANRKSQSVTPQRRPLQVVYNQYVR